MTPEELETKLNSSKFREEIEQAIEYFIKMNIKTYEPNKTEF